MCARVDGVIGRNANGRMRLAQTVTAKRQKEINVRLCNETSIYGAIKQTKHEYF